MTARRGVAAQGRLAEALDDSLAAVRESRPRPESRRLTAPRAGFLRCAMPTGIGENLPEWPCGDLHAWRLPALGMSRRLAVSLAELPDVVKQDRGRSGAAGCRAASTRVQTRALSGRDQPVQIVRIVLEQAGPPAHKPSARRRAACPDGRCSPAGTASTDRKRSVLIHNSSSLIRHGRSRRLSCNRTIGIRQTGTTERGHEGAT